MRDGVIWLDKSDLVPSSSEKVQPFPAVLLGIVEHLVADLHLREHHLDKHRQRARGLPLFVRGEIKVRKGALSTLVVHRTHFFEGSNKHLAPPPQFGLPTTCGGGGGGGSLCRPLSGASSGVL
eukprot:36527-Prorocentrum_minimum.AAC.4